MFEWYQIVLLIMQLAVPVFFLRRAIARGEFRTRFSLRFVFGLMTIVAVSFGIMRLTLPLAFKLLMFVTFVACAGFVLTAIEDRPR
ncbi:MAG TPA: hypothetical protein VF278_24210 [Pirellulales bacterium]